MSETAYSHLQQAMADGGIASVLSQLASQLRDEKRYHELFESLKMRVRHRLGLPLLYGGDGEDLDPSTREQLEEGLLQACREVGMLLMDSGQIRDGWVYLRPLGEKRVVADLLAQQPIRDDNVEQFVELLLHEAIDTERGYQLVLDHYGTCNAITTMQSALYGRPKPERRVAGKLLVRHVHDELLSNVKAHIAREENVQPASERLAELIAGREWLFEGGTYHIDTSHLSSTVQIAGELTDEPSLALALDLTVYGRKLDRQLQYPGEEPFVDLYPSMALFFTAQLGQDVEQALKFFQTKARGVRPREDGTGCIEVYIDLLARVGKTSEAIDATLEMIPRGISTTGRAPALLELCEQANQFDRMQAVCQERGDLLGYAVALMCAEGCSSARR